MRIPFLRQRVQQAAAAKPALVAETIPAGLPEPAGRDGQEEAWAEWFKLAAMQRRTYATLRAEIEGTSAFVEQNVVRLAGDFARLAQAAGEQTQRVERIIGVCDSVETTEETLPLSEVTRLLDETLEGTLTKILDVSAHAMNMVTALDEVQGHIGLVEQCIGRIDTINRTTNLLALNAMIEAARAGEHGKSFAVVASEVKELSHATNELAAMMRGEIGAVVEGLRQGSSILTEVARLDMSEQKQTKARLDRLLGGLLRHREQVEGMIKDASGSSAVIEQDIGRIIVGMQFEDRSKQRLNHVTDALTILDQVLSERLPQSDEAVGELDVESGWLKTLLDRCTMAEVRKRFASQLLMGKPPPVEAVEESSGEGDIELF